MRGIFLWIVFHTPHFPINNKRLYHHPFFSTTTTYLLWKEMDDDIVSAGTILVAYVVHYFISKTL